MAFIHSILQKGPFYQVGAKLIGCQIVRCQIVHFLILVPNCPFAFLVPNCPFSLSWCQIVCFLILVPNCPFLLSWCQIVPCQIVLTPKFLFRIFGGEKNKRQSYKTLNDRTPIALEKIQSQFFLPILSSYWSCQWFMSGMVFQKACN